MVNFNCPDFINHLSFVVIRDKHLMLIEDQIDRFFEVGLSLDSLKNHFSCSGIDDDEL